MCVRYILAQRARAEKAFGIQRLEWDDKASYNIAPRRDVPVVRIRDGECEGVMMRWGLIPSFLKGQNPKYPTINARVETMEASPAYRGPWQRSQRCVVPADAFYEWQMLVDGGRQPWLVQLANQEIMPFAALWESSVKSDGTEIESCAIITLPANEFMARIHNVEQRMPAILRVADVDKWLRGTPEQARELLIQYPGEELHAHQVSERVNSKSNDDPELMLQAN